MRVVWIIALFLFFSVPGWAQREIDSLKTLLKTNIRQGDTAQSIRNSAYLGYYFFVNKQYDSALRYYYLVSQKKTRFIDSLLLATSRNGIGAIYSATGFPDSSLYYYTEALMLFNSLNDTTQAIEVESNMIIIYKDMGMFERALELSFGVLDRLERKEPSRALASCYNSMAFVYEKTGDFADAIRYHRKALAIRQKIRYRSGVAASYNNIGLTYHRMTLYDSAIVELSKALAIKDSLRDVKSAASTLNNLGEVFLDENKLKEAEGYFVRSLKIKRESNDRTGLVITLNNLVKLKLRQHASNEALPFLRESERLARQTRSLDDLRQALELYIQVFRAKNDAASALKFYDELFVVKDSLLNIDKAKSLRSLSVQYETEKKEQQIILLEQRDAIRQAELGNKQTTIKALWVGVLLLIVIAVLIFENFRTVRKSKRRIEMLLKELHHRVKNNLQILSSVLALQSEQLTDEDAIRAVKSSEGRINAMALIHRKLYNVDQRRDVNIKDYVAELIQYLLGAYGYQEKDIKVDIHVPSIFIDVDKAIPVGLILNELISNAFKYAYVDHADPRLHVALYQQSSKLQIQVGDNGKGIDTRHSAGKENSFGLKMTSMLMRELHGNLSVQVNGGTHYTLNIPLD